MERTPDAERQRDGDKKNLKKMIRIATLSTLYLLALTVFALAYQLAPVAG